MIVLLYTITLLAMLSIVYIERKKPGEALAWILILIIFPVGGIVLYLILGGTYRFKVRRTRLKQKYPEQFARLQQYLPRWEGQLEEEPYGPVLNFNYNYSNSVYSPDNSITIFTSGQEKYDRLFKDIEEARSHIHLLYFGLARDEVGQKLIKALSRKAREGVEVRLLYDRMGSIFTPRYFFRELLQAGGQVVSIRPFLFDINYRNHRKIVVIDGKTGYSGGMNIGKKFLDAHPRRRPWRDTHLRLEGTALYQLQFIFINDWMVAQNKIDPRIFSELDKFFPEISPQGSIGVQVVASGADDDQNIKMGYLRMLGAAKKRVWLQTPYLIPDETVYNGLLVAASSGLDVRIMLPSIPGNRLLKHSTNYYLDRLLDYGVRVFYYQGYIHAKTVLIDDYISCVGSVNLDVRSLEINDEIYLLIHSPEFNQEYEQVFIKDQKKSREMDYQDFKNRGLYPRFWEGIFSFFSPLV